MKSTHSAGNTGILQNGRLAGRGREGFQRLTNDRMEIQIALA